MTFLFELGQLHGQLMHSGPWPQACVLNVWSPNSPVTREGNLIIEIVTMTTATTKLYYTSTHS